MRFFKNTHAFYAGIDLHARTLYLCVLHHAGNKLLHRELPCRVDELNLALAPYRKDLVVACETTFCWYWLADFCHERDITFVLGHALFMKAIHGGKAKNDRIDAEKIAALLRGGVLPQAYVYPAGMRETRDLLRRRSSLVRQRSQAMVHIQLTNAQWLFPVEMGKRLQYASKRIDIDKAFGDPSVQLSVASDLANLDHFDEEIRKLELHLERSAKVDDSQAFFLLKTIPGVGKVLALTMLYEIHDIGRFPTVGNFISYCRLVKCAHTSAGKSYGTGGAKIGNAHLRWAFGEAAVLLIRESAEAKSYVDRMTKKHGKPKAISILAAKIARTVYHMLRRKQAFDAARFWNTLSTRRKPTVKVS